MNKKSHPHHLLNQTTHLRKPVQLTAQLEGKHRTGPSSRSSDAKMSFSETAALVLFAILILIRFLTALVRLLDVIEEGMYSLNAPVEELEGIYGRITGGNEGMENAEGLSRLSGPGEEDKED